MTSVVDKNVKHVRISNFVQVKFIDDQESVMDTIEVDSNVFSIDITDNPDARVATTQLCPLLTSPRG